MYVNFIFIYIKQVLNAKVIKGNIKKLSRKNIRNIYDRQGLIYPVFKEPLKIRKLTQFFFKWAKDMNRHFLEER